MTTSSTLPDGTTLIKSDCILCVAGCGIDAYVKDGKLVKVKGMPEHPLNRGRLCPRGDNLVEYANARDRVLHPMKKVDGAWQRLSWEQALDEITDKLAKIKAEFGAHALTVYNGSMATENVELATFTQRFKGAFGTPNLISVESICFRIRVVAHLLTFGRYTSEDPYTSACAVVWGSNMDQSRFMWADMLHERADRDETRLIVIDPKRTPLAKKGLHLQIRPGTDIALGLGFLNVIISEGMYDQEYMDKYTLGFEELKEHVKPYTPEKVEGITWVPAADIRRAARIMALTKPMAIIPGTCVLAHSGNALQAERLLCIIETVTGNLDTEGGWAMCPLVKLTDLRIPVEEEPVGAKEFPMFYKTWGRPVPYGQAMPWPDQVLSGKPYPIKALIATGGNPALTMPETKKTVEAIKKLDLVVTFNPFMTETAEISHYVLPACTFLEKMGLGMVYGINSGLPYMLLRKQVCQPPGEAWADWKIWTELARRLGMEKYFPWKTDEEVISMLLEPSGVTLQQLKEKPEGFFFDKRKYDARDTFGFRTPSKKIEIFSQALKDAGFDPIPAHREPTQSPVSTPELAKKYPLILITGGRMKEFTHTQCRNMTQMRRRNPEPIAEIHPTTARDYGIINHDMIYVETPKGRIKLKVRVTEDIAPKVVTVPHGWAQANANDLTDLQAFDPVSGYPQIKGLLCRVYRADS